MNLRHSAPARGFSLMELMIGAAIAFVIFLAGMTAISMTLRTREDSTSRVRSAESARLLFDLIARDFAGANKGPAATPLQINTSITPNDNAALIYQNGTSDVLQFYTESDIQPNSPNPVLGDIPELKTPERINFVRYYVHEDKDNSLPTRPVYRMICREVIATLPANALQTEPIPSDYSNAALFDGVRNFQVFYHRYNAINNTYDPPLNTKNPGPPAGPPTHLRIRLTLDDSTKTRYEQMKDEKQPQNLQQAQFRVYEKVLPMPAALQ